MVVYAVSTIITSQTFTMATEPVFYPSLSHVPSTRHESFVGCNENEFEVHFGAYFSTHRLIGMIYFNALLPESSPSLR